MVMRSKGYTLNHKTVLKLMRILDLKGKQRKNETYRSYKGEVGKIADNILILSPVSFSEKTTFLICPLLLDIILLAAFTIT